MKNGWKLLVAAAAVLLAAAPAAAQRGPGHEPPQEAFAACASLKAGDACTVTFGGKTVQGTCRGPADKAAACAPNDMPPPGGHRGHHGPPQAALDACKSLSDGASCSFTMDDGNSISGSCRTCPKSGQVACAPAGMPPPGEHRGPPQAALDACQNLRDGDTCSFTMDSSTVKGSCRTGPNGEAAACAPSDMPPMGEHRGPPQAALDACQSLRDGDTCSFTLDGNAVKGSCRTGPNGEAAACLPSDFPRPPHGH